jgi:hypothetical protein
VGVGLCACALCVLGPPTIICISIGLVRMCVCVACSTHPHPHRAFIFYIIPALMLFLLCVCFYNRYIFFLGKFFLYRLITSAERRASTRVRARSEEGEGAHTTNNEQQQQARRSTPRSSAQRRGTTHASTRRTRTHGCSSKHKSKNRARAHSVAPSATGSHEPRAATTQTDIYQSNNSPQYIYQLQKKTLNSFSWSGRPPTCTPLRLPLRRPTPP